MTAHPAHLEDLADRIRPRVASSLLLWLIFGFFLVFVIWASVVKLDRTVHAAGRVVPSGRLQAISNQEGGTVAAILVQPGDFVRKGQSLVRLDPAQSSAELGSNVATIAALEAKIARLQAEIAGQQPAYPRSRNASEAQGIDIERSLHAARMADLAGQSAAAQARLLKAWREVAEARAAHASKIAARDSARKQLVLLQPLVERGIEPRISLIQAENQATISASDVDQAAAAVARAQAEVDEAVASITQVHQTWRAQAGADLSTAQAELASRSHTTEALADRFARTTLAAPVDGRVNRVLVTTVGSSVAPHQPIVEVVPSHDLLTVEAQVLPKDIAGVRIGQRARINITAYESAIYGAMDGEVIAISPDATVEEKTGESHYTVRIRTRAETLRDQNGRRLPISSGMTADVNLIGDKRSVMAYLLTPIARLQDSALRE